MKKLSFSYLFPSPQSIEIVVAVSQINSYEYSNEGGLSFFDPLVPHFRYRFVDSTGFYFDSNFPVLPSVIFRMDEFYDVSNIELLVIDGDDGSNICSIAFSEVQ